MITKSPIRQPYLYGTLYTDDETNRQCEVVRMDAHTWATFFYQDRMQLCLGIDTPGMSQGDATSQALKYMRHGELPPGPITPFKSTHELK